MTPSSSRKSGLAPLGDIPWGTHISHFFHTAGDLIETLVPFFAAGLEQQERCVWLVFDPLTVEAAAAAVHGLDVEVIQAHDWYMRDGSFDAAAATEAWSVLLDEALQRGRAGLRACGGAKGWLRLEDSGAFRRYEASLDRWLVGKRVILLCSYPLSALGVIDVLDVARNHHVALAKRDGEWEVLLTADTSLHARNLQQAAIAALGQTAIREHDLSLVMNEAVELAARTLGTGRSLLWQVDREREHLVQRARAGWDELPSDATFPLVSGSIADYVVRNAEPLMVADLRIDRQFEQSWVLRDYAIVTMLSAAVRSRDRTWGLLSVHSQTRRAFTEDDVAFLQSMANVLALAIERDEYEREELRKHELVLTIFDHMPVMISVWSATGKLLRVNRAWELCLGWSGEEALALDISTLFLDTESWDRSQKLLSQADRRWYDFRLRTRDGGVVDTSWATFRLSDGTIIGFGVDITERKRIEEAQEAARATAESALAKLRAIQSITDTAVGHTSLDELLTELLARLRQALQTDHAALLFLDEKRQHFVVRAIEGFAPEPMRSFPIAITSPISGTVLKEQRAMIFNDLPLPEAPAWGGWPDIFPLLPRSAMAAPVVVEGKFIGTISVTSAAPRQFTGDELDLLRMVVDRAAPAIERARLLEQIRVSEKRLEALSRRLLTVQEEERRRIAVELHDELGQIHTAVKIKLGSVQRSVGDRELAAHLGEAIQMVEGAVGTVRDLALDLRPAMLDDLGLGPALRWYADRFARQTGIELHLAIGEFPPLDPAIATACFRVVQEAFTNVARHAAARNVWLDVHAGAGEVELNVRDDGIGFDVAAARDRALRGESLGLLGMEERVSYTRGTLQVKSVPGAGTTITANVPLANAESV
ncbi:MAG TPA: GAF domain-containing protein [Thermoanaerobaculia bacterium]|nr:GAF domain-containing protein [Thermoanaerobaculia bacterium]